MVGVGFVGHNITGVFLWENALGMLVQAPLAKTGKAELLPPFRYVSLYAQGDAQGVGFGKLPFTAGFRNQAPPMHDFAIAAFQQLY
ncbi:hypothetical protein LJC47_01495 [Desulfosarcina sp. OttesenSCG-928-B08]|nr:hypothetical protein [Desulfosarcina sp. OttesenSCG-928-B08]